MSESGRPLLSHLRDSGTLEQNADIVIGVWPITNYMEEKEKQKTINGFQEGWEPYVLSVLKNRGGAVGDADCMWNRASGKIESITEVCLK